MPGTDTVELSMTANGAGNYLTFTEGTWDVRVTPSGYSSLSDTTIPNVVIAADRVLDVSLVVAPIVTVNASLRLADGSRPKTSYVSYIQLGESAQTPGGDVAFQAFAGRSSLYYDTVIDDGPTPFGNKRVDAYFNEPVQPVAESVTRTVPGYRVNVKLRTTSGAAVPDGAWSMGFYQQLINRDFGGRHYDSLVSINEGPIIGGAFETFLFPGTNSITARTPNGSTVSTTVDVTGPDEVVMTVPDTVPVTGTLRLADGTAPLNSNVSYDGLGGSGTVQGGNFAFTSFGGNARLLYSATIRDAHAYRVSASATEPAQAVAPNLDLFLPGRWVTIHLKLANGDPAPAGLWDLEANESRYGVEIDGRQFDTISTTNSGWFVDNAFEAYMLPGDNTVRILTGSGADITRTVTVADDHDVYVTVPDSIHVTGTIQLSDGSAPQQSFVMYPSLGRSYNFGGNNFSFTALNGIDGLSYFGNVRNDGGQTTSFSADEGSQQVASHLDLLIPGSWVSIRLQNANGDPVPSNAWTLDTHNDKHNIDLDGHHYGNLSMHNTGAFLNNTFDTYMLPGANTITLRSQFGGLLKQNVMISGPKTIVFVFNPDGSYSIDDQAPDVTGVADRDPDHGQWYNAPVTVTWTAVDPAPSSGPASTPAPVVVSTDGDQDVVSAPSCDPGGLCATGTKHIRYDATGPTVTVNGSGPNTSGWYSGPVTWTPACTDAVSGIASCPAAKTYDGPDGQDVHLAWDDAFDNAGNHAPVATTFSYDATAPSISWSLTPLPNDHEWNTGDVLVRFTCSDATSGPRDCPADRVVSGDGTHSESVTVHDNAGNSTTVLVMVKIDGTKPDVSLHRSREANAAGWHNAPVTVATHCTDSGSGVASCSDDQVISIDGETVVTGIGTDIAGNTGSATTTVRLDQVAPSIAPSASVAPNASGWNRTPVTISFACTDDRSGVAFCPSPVTVSSTGTTILSRIARDNAGNESTVSITVKIDGDAPTIVLTPDRAANSKGWYNASVVVHATCLDSGGSGVASCPIDQTVAANGINTVTGTATDIAGNSASASLVLAIDTVNPGGTITTPSGQLYIASGQITGTASDALSGVGSVTVAFSSLAGVTSVPGVMTCNAGHTSCTWKANVPAGLLAIYSVTATIRDDAGNAFAPGSIAVGRLL